MTQNFFDKVWYIKNVDSEQEGPYSIAQLRLHSQVTPDTLVWKEGFSAWVPIRGVPELAVVFQEPKPLIQTLEVADPVEKGTCEMALDMRNDLPPYFLWALLLILLGCFFLFLTDK